MKKSLVEAFNIERKPSKTHYVSDYEIFPDKKLLDDLRTKIVENLIDKEIPEEKLLNHLKQLADFWISKAKENGLPYILFPNIEYVYQKLCGKSI